MNTHGIPALKEKRAAIAGRVISLKKQIARHQKELASNGVGGGLPHPVNHHRRLMLQRIENKHSRCETQERHQWRPDIML